MKDEKGSSLDLSTLTALSPLDGRYRETISSLASVFSEYGLIKQRLEVECKWLIALSEGGIIKPFSAEETRSIDAVSQNFSLKDGETIKQHEGKTRHDVKAVELFLRERLKESLKPEALEYIHFGLTSEDINNLAYRLMLKRASENILLPTLLEIVTMLSDTAKKYKLTPMLARTHGQAAIPTTLGKELVVFVERLVKETTVLKNHEFSGKLAGAVGNYNALVISYENIDWIKFSKKFIKQLGLSQSPATTQINTYEDIISFFQVIQRINNVLIDFNQDMWRYISDSWFIQEVRKDEVGSSTMPQKVNPIYFENAEGNLGMANSMIEFFSRKLSVSRLQRDLSDSTVIRNFGACLGYSFLAYQSTKKGFSRVRPNVLKIEEDLIDDWSILAEAAQTILRKNGTKDPYTLLKKLTRGEKIPETRWREIINSLQIDEDARKNLLKLSPKKYIGLAPKIVDDTLRKMASLTK